MAGFFKDEARMIKHIGRGDRIRPRRISIGVVSLNSNLCFNWENNSKRWDVRKILRQPQLQGVASLLLAKKTLFRLDHPSVRFEFNGLEREWSHPAKSKSLPW